MPRRRDLKLRASYPCFQPHGKTIREMNRYRRLRLLTQSHRSPPLGPGVVNFVDRRAESRYSDVSMHAGCEGFPMCTTEDEEGSILHIAPNGPASIVRGRKEGSSPAKRKSTNTTANSSAEKKLRRSSRLLQHDSGHENVDSDKRTNGDSIERDGTGVVESS